MSDLRTDFRIVKGSALFYGDDEPGQKALQRIEASLGELLDSLRAAVAAKDAELDGFRRNLGRDPLVMPEWLAPARAAIAKAEGR